MIYKTLKRSFFILFFCFIASSSIGQGTYEDYRRAEKYLHFNIMSLVRNTSLNPNWINETNDFWFKYETEAGHAFKYYDSKTNNIKQAFDHIDLSEKLLNKTEIEFHPDSLPISPIQYSDNQESISFKLDTFKFKYHLKNKTLEKIKNEKLNKNDQFSTSPDGNWEVFVKDHNLFIRSTENQKETQLTYDGKEKYSYGQSVSWYSLKDESSDSSKHQMNLDISWSTDSRKFVTYLLDRRKTKNLYLYQSMPDTGMRAKIWSYERPLPGENSAAMMQYFVFDVENKKGIKIETEPFEGFLLNINPTWLETGDKFYFAKFSRGYKSLDFYMIDATDGSVAGRVHDESETMVEYQMVHHYVYKKGDKVLLTSERDGWNHIYLFDLLSGNTVNQITKGSYVVRDIVHVDEKSDEIWFTASGKEDSRDPYFVHLYKTDGKKTILLTPEDAEHNITFSPDHSVFIDNFSRVDLKPKAVIRDANNGSLIRKVQEANIDQLVATGWKHPVRFKVKARDGKTDLYGVLFFPSNLDETKKYPMIDNSYSGPQAVNAPKRFMSGIWNDALPLAEIGFIVMKLDGMGTAMRSKAFHNYSYENLGDIGAPDHISAIRQLAEQYKFIDTVNVGIYGFSAGGYDAAHALLTHPDFYKVGVAAAGNHDHAMAKAWWPEQYMGFPGNHYIEQSNLTLAKNLKGNLLLVHGDMDNNVNPASTLRLAGELIKNNKDFDLIIVPNDDHSELWHNTYLIRKRMDYFTKHLWHKEPPKEFEFKKY